MPVNDQDPTEPLDSQRVWSQHYGRSHRPRQQAAGRERSSALGTLTPPPRTPGVPPEDRRPPPQPPRPRSPWRADVWQWETWSDADAPQWDAPSDAPQWDAPSDARQRGTSSGVWQWDTWSEDPAPRMSVPPGADLTSDVAVPAGTGATSQIMPPNGHGPEALDQPPPTGRRTARHVAARRDNPEGDEAGASPRRTPAFLVAAASATIVMLGATVALAITDRGPFGGSRVELDSNQATARSVSPGADAALDSEEPEEPEEPVTEEPAEPEPEEPSVPDSHTVSPGETLESIAAEYGLEWRLLFDANDDVERPDLLLKGQTLAIPPPDADLPRRELPKPPEPEPLVTALSDSDTSQESAEEPPPDQPAVPDGSVWDRLAQCESGGNWSINTGNGYYGGLQFSLSSWQAVGGSGLPSEHSREEQIRRGEILRARQGWGAWPSCASKLGLL